MPIENMDQARAAAARIRSPETSEEEKDALMNIFNAELEVLRTEHLAEEIE